MRKIIQQGVGIYRVSKSIHVKSPDLSGSVPIFNHKPDPLEREVKSSDFLWIPRRQDKNGIFTTILSLTQHPVLSLSF